MNVTLEFNDRSYINWSVDELLAAGVPESVVNSAVNQEQWKPALQERNNRLFETDWTQGQDSPLSPEKVAEFATYRQELRDIPQTYSNPDDVVWPEKPSL